MVRDGDAAACDARVPAGARPATGSTCRATPCETPSGVVLVHA